MVDLFDINDSSLAQLASNPAVHQQFPGMFVPYQNAVEAVGQCAACTKQSAIDRRNREARQLREAIARMSPDAIARLKAVIGVRTIRVVAGVTPQGQPIRHTF